MSNLNIVLYTISLIFIVPVICIFFDAYGFPPLGLVLGGLVLTASSLALLIKGQGGWKLPSMWSIRSWVQWRVRVVALMMTVVGIGMMGFGVYKIFTPSFTPSKVYVHMPVGSWRSVDFAVEDALLENQNSWRHFTADIIDVPVAALSYGHHLFNVEWSDGQKLWFRIWTNDPAKNRRHDVYVTYENGIVQLKEILNGEITRANVQVKPQDTSLEQPFSLSDCCL